MTKAVAKQEPAQVTNISDIAVMMDFVGRMFSDPGCDPAKLERGLATLTQMQKSASVRAFNVAIADAKAEIPTIIKRRQKTGQGGNFDYEDLAGIAKTIDPILARHGLSYRFKSSSADGQVTVTCVIAHRDGHSEENSLSSAPDTSGSKNSIQAIGSVVTYLQRYTLKLALGLSASKDDDGNAAGSAITTEQVKQLEKLAKDVGADTAKFCEFMDVTSLSEIPAGQFVKAKRLLETRRGKKVEAVGEE